MLIERTKIPGVVVYTPDVYADERGYFKETLNPYFNVLPLQANQSHSHKGVIRGLHYQPGAGKLVWVVKGSIYDVALDPQTGQWIGIYLSDVNHKMVYIPPGYAHGFQAQEDDTVVCYLMTDYYNPKTEGGYSPQIIPWPIKKAIISDKDKNAPVLRI